METCVQTNQEMESLYVELNGSDQIPLTTLSVIFLHQFCACSNYNVIQVDTKDKPSQPLNDPSQPNNKPSHRVNTNNDKSSTAVHFPAHIVSSSMKWSELPDVVKSCDLPAIVDAQEVVCYTGLCTVLRRIVMMADIQYPLKNLISLLGFRQTNLKTCSEVSPWTKLCEVQAPKDIADFQNECDTAKSAGYQVTCIPEAVQVFDDYLSQPVNVFNSVYRQQRLRKSGSTTDDTNTTCKQLSGNSGLCLDAAYKNAIIIKDKRKYKQSLHAGRINQDSALVTKESSKHNDVGLPLSKLSLSKDSNFDVTKESTSGMNNCADHKELFAEEVLEERIKEMNLGENTVVPASSSMDNKLKTELNDHNSKKGKKKLCSKKHCTEELLPPLEHTFAEGPDLTLADLALFPYIHIFLTLLNRVGCCDLCRTIPFVLRWYKTMLNVPNVMETAVLCGLTVLELPNENFADSTIGKAKQKADKQEADFGKGKSRKAVKAAVKRELPGILNKLQSCPIQIDDILHSTELDWNSFSSDINPCQDVDEKRARNKQNQVESLVAAVKMIAKERCRIVDFCSGGGHVGIVLAYLLPACHIAMIENNEESLRRAATRVKRIGFKNVTLYQSNIDYFTAEFDIGVSLHACGVATDLVLAKCQLHKAAFVCSPCCYGGLQNTHLITYPRSQLYKAAGITCEEHFIVGHAAEQTSWDFESEHSKRGKVCMEVIDTDRAYAAREQDYNVQLCSLQPSTCSPKNNLLVGWHKHRDLVTNLVSDTFI